MNLSKYLIRLFFLGAFPLSIIFAEPLEQRAGIHSFVNEGFQSKSKFNLPEIPTMEDYIYASMYNNPVVKAAYAGWQREVEAIAVEKGLPNPSVNLGYFLTNVETAVGPQEYKVGLLQKIPWFGKLRLAGEIQTIKAEIELEKLQAAINSLVFSVTDVYLDYYLLQRSIDITSGNIELVRNWEQVVRSKYTTARIGHPHLIKTQIELLKLEDDLATLTARKEPLLQQFRALVNDMSINSISLPDSLEDISPIDKASVASVISTGNPDYRAAVLRQKLSGAATKKARLNYYPDLGIGLDYIGTGKKQNGGSLGSENGKDPLVLLMSLQVPIWFGRTKSQVNATRYQQRSADEDLITIENKLQTELEQIWFELEDASRKIVLYEQGLLPKSLESLRASEKAYVSEKMDFLNLVDAERRYLQFLLEYEKARVNYSKAFARLELLAGRDL